MDAHRDRLVANASTLPMELEERYKVVIFDHAAARMRNNEELIGSVHETAMM